MTFLCRYHVCFILYMQNIVLQYMLYIFKSLCHCTKQKYIYSSYDILSDIVLKDSTTDLFITVCLHIDPESYELGLSTRSLDVK